MTADTKVMLTKAQLRWLNDYVADDSHWRVPDHMQKGIWAHNEQSAAEIMEVMRPVVTEAKNSGPDRDYFVLTFTGDQLDWLDFCLPCDDDRTSPEVTVPEHLRGAMQATWEMA